MGKTSLHSQLFKSGIVPHKLSPPHISIEQKVILFNRKQEIATNCDTLKRFVAYVNTLWHDNVL